MTPFQTKRRDVLFELFDKFPDLSNRGTAVILYRDNPEFFKSIEDARHLVRLYRGKVGSDARVRILIKKYYR